MKFNFVYKTTNNLNGDYYYGVHSTNNLDDGYLGSGLILKHAINKYGIDNFTREIVQYFSDVKYAFRLEAAIVTPELVADPHCYNIAVGGYGGNTLAGFTDEQYNEFCNKNRQSHNKPEYIKKLSDIKKEHWQRHGYREYWSKWFSENNPMKREDVKQKQSSSRIQYYIDHPEVRQWFSENNPMKREDVKQKTRHPHKMSADGLKRLKAGAEKRKGSNNGVYGKTYKWMNDGIRNYRVDLDKVEYQLSQGLKIGCLQKHERTNNKSK